MGVLSYLLSNQPVGAGAAAVTGRDIVRVSQDPAISGSVRKPGGIAFRSCATQHAAAYDSSLSQSFLGSPLPPFDGRDPIPPAAAAAGDPRPVRPSVGRSDDDNAATATGNGSHG